MQTQNAGLEGVDDGDLFMLDTGLSTDAALVLRPAGAKGEANEVTDAPAWEDSDDERLHISLAGAPRLR